MLRKLMMVGAIVTLSLGFGVPAGAYSFGGPTLSTNTSTVPAGGSLEVFCTNYAPNETVTLTLTSTPVILGTTMTNSAGACSTQVTIPLGTVLGNHTITGTGTTGDFASTGIFVTGTAAPVSTVGSTGGLAFTGADIAAASGVGAIAVGIGGMLILMSRRKRRANG